MLRNCSRRLRAVATFRELSMTSNFGCFASSLNAPLVLDTIYDKFINIIKQTINEHAPMKIASRKRQKLVERPWITRGLLVPIKRKQKMYKTHFLSKDENLISLYRFMQTN